MIYLTIIPRVRVGYEMVVANEVRSAELAIIISYPTSARGMIVKYIIYDWIAIVGYSKHGEFLFVKTTDFQLVFKSEQTRTVTIFGEPGIMAHIP